MENIDKILDNDKKLQALTSLNKSAFAVILGHFTALWETYHRWHDGKGKKLFTINGL